MATIDKYTTDAKDEKKILVSNEAMLHAELLEELKHAIDNMRLQ